MTQHPTKIKQNMTNDELTTDFIRIKTNKKALPLQTPNPAIDPSSFLMHWVESWSPAELEVLVRQITWRGPHTPSRAWVKVACLPEGADQKRIKKEIRRVLNLKTYFKVCDVCGKKKPTGWMGGYTCHSCMEDQGAVF